MCNKINKQDYFYGIFLSSIIDSKKSPVLIDKDKSRGLYKLSTDKSKYKVYIKYAMIDKNRKTWNFSYSKENIEEIKNLIENSKEEIVFSYICSYKDLLNTEIVISNIEELKKCIDPNCKINDRFRISINKKPGSKYLRMYGTKRDISKAIEIDRYRIENL